MTYQCQLKFQLISKNVVDCQWGEWEVSGCDKTCGGGSRKKTRIPHLDAMHGGQECEGHSNVIEGCNYQKCPSRAGNLTGNVVIGRLLFRKKIFEMT